MSINSAHATNVQMEKKGNLWKRDLFELVDADFVIFDLVFVAGYDNCLFTVLFDFGEDLVFEFDDGVFERFFYFLERTPQIIFCRILLKRFFEFDKRNGFSHDHTIA